MAEKSSLTVEEVLPLLAAAPRRMAELTEGLLPEQLRAAPAEGQWSANDVLTHLRACADVWGGCIARILDEDQPTMRGLDPRHWTKIPEYLALEFRPSLRAFDVQRVALLTALEALPLEGWARFATVYAWGVPYQRTVLSFAQRLARHERSHLKQIARIADALRKGAPVAR